MTINGIATSLEMTACTYFELMNEEIQDTIFCKTSIEDNTFTEAMYVIIKGMSKNLEETDNEVINDNLEGFLNECKKWFGEKTKNIPIETMDRLYNIFHNLYLALNSIS